MPINARPIASSRFLILLTGAILCAMPSQAQHTLIRKDGRHVPCEVKGLTAGQVDYIEKSGAQRDMRQMPCSEVAAVVDESLMVHNVPCADPISQKRADCPRNCDAVVDNTMRVTKGTITVFGDDRYEVRTRHGDVKLPRSEVIAVISSGHVDFNLPPAALQKLMSDPVIVAAMNNTAACAVATSAPVVKYSEAWSKKNWERSAAKEPRTRQPMTGLTADAQPFVFKDTVQRGLSDTLDFDLFKDVAMEKTKRLKTYISQITDKTLPGYTKNSAVNQALSLFESADNLVHVSNVKTGKESVYPVQSYLNTHLRRLNYDKVELEWADLNYTSDFELQPDSSYQAVISLQQRFTGYIDGKPYYSDVTNKNVSITLRRYERVIMGRTERLWDVFLSDIGVSATKAG